MHLSNFICLAPESFLIVSSLILLVLGLFTKKKIVNILAFFFTTGAFTIGTFTHCIDSFIWPDLLEFDLYSSVSRSILYLIGSVLLSLLVSFPSDVKNERYENCIILMLLLIGSSSLLFSASFIPMYVSVEIQSIASYALLCCYGNQTVQMKESAVKYLISGAVSSCILLFGISLVYLYAESLNFSDIKLFLQNEPKIPAGSILGFLFIIVGMSFKLSVFPMHAWVPNIYQTSKSFVAMVIAVLPKFAFFMFFIKFLYYYIEIGNLQNLSNIVEVFGLLSVVLGSLCALSQVSIKRMIGYASISHAGHIVMALSTGLQSGVNAAIVYLIVYLLMTIAFFCFLISLGENVNTLSDLVTLKRSNPFSCFFFCVLIFSMAGFPPFLGFFIKFFVIKSLIDAGDIYFTSILLLMNVISAYYYLKIAKYLYLETPKESSKESSKESKIIIPFNYSLFLFLIFSSVNVVCIFGFRALFEFVDKFSFAIS